MAQGNKCATSNVKKILKMYEIKALMMTPKVEVHSESIREVSASNGDGIYTGRAIVIVGPPAPSQLYERTRLDHNQRCSIQVRTSSNLYPSSRL